MQDAIEKYGSHLPKLQAQMMFHGGTTAVTIQDNDLITNY